MRTAARAALVSLVLFGACKSEPTQPNAQIKPAPGNEAPAEQKAQPALKAAPALATTKAARAIPRDAFFVASSGPLADVVARLGRDEIVKRLQPHYAKAVAELKKIAGHDLLDPANLPAIGLDPDAPVGVVVLDVEEAAVAFFAGTRDAEKFETWLRDTARKGAKLELSVEDVGEGAKLLWAERDTEVVFVLRDGIAWLVASDRRSRTVDRARSIAVQKADASLGADPAFAAALKRLPHGRDAAGFLNTRVLVDRFVREISSDRRVRMLEREVRWARDRNDAQALREAEERLRTRRREAALSIGKRQATGVLVRGFLAPLGPLTMGLEIQEATLAMAFDFEIKAKSIFHRLMVNREGPSTLARVVAEPPLFMLDGKLDLGAVDELRRTAITASGGARDWDEARREIQQALGIDLESDPAKLLTGEAGISVGLPPGFDLVTRSEELPDAIGGTLLVGVKDEARVKTLMARLSGMAAANAPGVVTTRDDRYELAVPGWRTVHVGLAGGYLVATTDAGLIDRVAKPAAATSFATGLKHAGLKALFQRTGTAAMGSLDWHVMAMFYLGRSTVVPTRAEIAAPAQGDPTAARKAELERRVREAEKKVDAAQARFNKAVAALGTQAATLRVEPHGLVMLAGQYFGAPIRQVIAEMVDSGVALEEAERARWDDTRPLRRELQELNRPKPEPAELAPAPAPKQD